MWNRTAYCRILVSNYWHNNGTKYRNLLILSMCFKFQRMGIVEELGSGMRKMFKYTPLYANGKEPVIEEQDVYRIEIPYIPTL